mmetsp:Transcript_17735/g.41707  ORF Transcript_17735/g.41707 Transcript_17735/m.41707 type:complete len:218 (-) Transcript_17735:2143-2796(-)
MCCANMSSGMAKAARTSSEEEVTPPLLALASLTITAPAFSSTRRASCVKNKLAPSTMMVNRDLPSASSSLPTLPPCTASGRPPQGTNTSAEKSGCKWNMLRKPRPDSTRSPLGRVTSRSLTSTRKPIGLNSETSKLSMVTRCLASRVISARLRPSGSKMTPDPSMMALVLSLDMRISLEPKSPSGPPVCTLVTSSSSRPKAASALKTFTCTLRVVMP